MKIRDVEDSSVGAAEQVQDLNVASSKLKDGYEEKLDLPSKYRPYKFKELYVRSFNTREVEMLESITNRRIHIELPDLINKVIEPKVAYELTTGDWWFVLLWLRVNTFKSSPMSIPWDCKKCESKNRTEINLLEIPIVELPEEYSEPAILPIGNKEELPLRLQRVGDEKFIGDYLNQMYGDDVEIPAGIESACAKAILIDTNDSLHNKLERYLELDPDKSRLVKEFTSEFAHGMKNQLSCKCEECESVQQIRFTFLFSDILPSKRDRASIRNAIRFG